MRDGPSVIVRFLEVPGHLRFDHAGLRAIGLLEPLPQSLMQPQAAPGANSLDERLRVQAVAEAIASHCRPIGPDERR